MAIIRRVVKLFTANNALLGGRNHRIPMSFSATASRLTFGFLLDGADIASQIIKPHPIRFAGGEFAGPVLPAADNNDLPIFVKRVLLSNLSM